MSQPKEKRQARRGRIFPQIQWTPEQCQAWDAQRTAFYNRCKPIFDQLKPQYIDTHYNWYMAIEPDSGDHFISQDNMEVIMMSRAKYPNKIVFVFRIDETGDTGRI